MSKTRVSWFGRQVGNLRAFVRITFLVHLEKVGLREPVASDELSANFAARTANWLVVACFAYRATVSPFTFIGAMGAFGSVGRLYLPVLLALMAWNAFLAIAVSRKRLRPLLKRREFFAVDLTIAVSVNIWAAAVLEQGTLLQPYRDIFWIYAMGTVATWTALKGARTGLLLSLMGGGVILAMVAVNGASVTGVGLTHIVARFGWLLSAVPLPVIIMRLAGQGAGLGSVEARRMGRVLHRVRALRAIHDTVLQTLAQIAQRTVMSDTGVRERARHIKELASRQLDELNQVMRADDHERSGLTDGLQSLVREFAGRGLDVNLTTSQLAADPPLEVADGLLGATREALTNVLKYSGVKHATVQAYTVGAGYEVQIRDHGRGFDPAGAHGGIGLSGSIRQRVNEVGGRVEIWSAPGQGTEITLIVTTSMAKRVIGVGISPSAVIALGGAQTTSVDMLTRNALAWFVVAALAYRVILSPLQLFTYLANLEFGLGGWFLAAYAAVFAFDLFLLVALLLGRFAAMFNSRALLGVDLVITCALNIWSAYDLPEGTTLMAGRDVLWGYTLGVVAFWTGLRGARTGIAIVVGGFALQIVMAFANHTSLTADAWPQLAARQGWLASTFVVCWLLTRLARKGAQQAVDDGVRAGLAIENTWLLRDVYGSATTALSRIVWESTPPPAITPATLKAIRGTALDLVERLRAAIDQDDGHDVLELDRALAQVAGTFRTQGLRVELVTTQIATDPPPAVLRAMVEAATMALTNVLAHSEVSHVVLRAQCDADRCEMVIRDRGPAAALRADEADIRRIMADIGGTAETLSTPGNGTRVRLSWQPAR